MMARIWARLGETSSVAAAILVAALAIARPNAALAVPPGCVAYPSVAEIGARLARAYPDFVIRVEKAGVEKAGVEPVGDDNTAGGAAILTVNGRFDIASRGASADFTALLDNPTLADQFAMPYPAAARWGAPPGRNCDPGRLRHEPFFRAMYGASKEEVESRLTTIAWGPMRLRATRVNGIDRKLSAIARELEALSRARPAFRPIWERAAGVYHWRPIRGTGRLSVHSFGAAIDLSVAHTEYWLNDIAEEGAAPVYRNRMPVEIVEIFARHGFIWGGAWSHYDTMHFEYRPELLLEEQ